MVTWLSLSRMHNCDRQMQFFASFDIYFQVRKSYPLCKSPFDTISPVSNRCKLFHNNYIAKHKITANILEIEKQNKINLLLLSVSFSLSLFFLLTASSSFLVLLLHLPIYNIWFLQFLNTADNAHCL